MKRARLAIVALVATSLTLTACSSGSNSGASGEGPNATPEKGGIVSFLATPDFSHLDPAMGFDGGVNNFYRLIYRTLTTPAAGKDGAKIVPDLATSLGKSNADATVWTFTLKDDIYFQDGKPITSQDVKFGVERSFDPALGIGSPYAKLYLADSENYKGPYQDPGAGLSSIETPDKKTIVFHLNRPVAEYSSVVAQNVFVPFPVGTGAGTSFDSKPIASGPYEVESYKRGSSLKLVRNPKWTAKTDHVRKAYPDGFAWTFGLDPATIDERVIAGQGTDVDALAGNVQNATIARIQTPALKARTVTGIQGCTTYMSLNTTKPNLGNPLVRQAIEYAIDKKTVLDATGGKLKAEIAHAIMPPTLAGHKDYDPYPSKGDTGDVAKAKQLLAEAGLPNGFDLTVDVRNQAAAQAQAEAIQQALARVNIHVNLNIIDVATYYEVIGTTSQQHDAAITGWCPDWTSGATFLPPLFDGRQIFPKGNSNLAQLNDPAVNGKIDEIAQYTDAKKAAAAYGDLDEQIMKLAPIVPLVYEKVLVLVGSNVGGAVSSPAYSGGIDLTGVGLIDSGK